MDELQAAKLDEIQYLLERMLELANAAASDECTDERRRELQKALDVLICLMDNAADELNSYTSN